LQRFIEMGGVVAKQWDKGMEGFAGTIPAKNVPQLALSKGVELVEMSQRMIRFSDVSTVITDVRTYVWDTLGYKGTPIVP